MRGDGPGGGGRQDGRVTRWGATDDGPVDVSRGRLDDLLEERGVRTVLGRDALLAVVVVVLTTAITLALPALLPADLLGPEEASVHRGSAGWLAAVAAVQGAALCVRRTALPWCLAAVVGCQALLAAVAPEETLRALAPVVAWYTAGVLLTVRRAGAALAVAVVVETATAGVAAATTGQDVATSVGLNALSAAVSGAVAVAVGLHVATRRRYLHLLRAEAAAAEAGQQERVRAAVAAERSRLARELHDVAAHHLSGMVVQAAAVERLVGRDPAAAREGAAWLREQGKQTLADLRQAVGLLRGPAGEPLGDAAARAPLPGLDALDDLVAQAREAGDALLVDVPPRLPVLPPLADASVFRVAQQALTNARQHAPGAPVRLALAVAGPELALDVVNGPAAAPGVRGGGTGLAVMRERAALVGGRLAAGPTPDGGWRVTLHVPVPDGPRDPGDEEVPA